MSCYYIGYNIYRRIHSLHWPTMWCQPRIIWNTNLNCFLNFEEIYLFFSELILTTNYRVIKMNRAMRVVILYGLEYQHSIKRWKLTLLCNCKTINGLLLNTTYTSNINIHMSWYDYSITIKSDLLFILTLILFFINF